MMCLDFKQLDRKLVKSGTDREKIYLLIPPHTRRARLFGAVGTNISEYAKFEKIMVDCSQPVLFSISSFNQIQSQQNFMVVYLVCVKSGKFAYLIQFNFQFLTFMEGYQIQENLQEFFLRNRKSPLTCIFKAHYMQIYASENPLKRVHSSPRGEQKLYF